jgi:hypothetical protein
MALAWWDVEDPAAYFGIKGERTEEQQERARQFRNEFGGGSRAGALLNGYVSGEYSAKNIYLYGTDLNAIQSAQDAEFSAYEGGDFGAYLQSNWSSLSSFMEGTATGPDGSLGSLVETPLQAAGEKTKFSADDFAMQDYLTAMRSAAEDANVPLDIKLSDDSEYELNIGQHADQPLGTYVQTKAPTSKLASALDRFVKSYVLSLGLGALGDFLNSVGGSTSGGVLSFTSDAVETINAADQAGTIETLVELGTDLFKEYLAETQEETAAPPEDVISEDVVSDLEAEQQETIETVDEAPVTTTVETVDETVDEAPVTTAVETVDETIDEAPVTTTVETVDETPVTTTVETVDETPVTTTKDATTTSSGVFSNWASAFSKDKEVDFWLSDPEAFATDDKYANRVGLSIDDIRNLFELRFGNSPSDEELRDYVSTIIESSRLSDWSSTTKNSYIDKILSGEYIVNVEEDQGDLLYQTLGYEDKQEYDDLAAELQAAEEDLLAEDEDLLGTADVFVQVEEGAEDGDPFFEPRTDIESEFPEQVIDFETDPLPPVRPVTFEDSAEEAGGGGATDATEAADTGEAVEATDEAVEAIDEAVEATDEAAEATDEAAEATDATQTDVTSTTDDSGEGGMLTGGEDVQDRPFAVPNGPWVYIGNGRWVQIDPDVLAQEGVVTDVGDGTYTVSSEVYENDANWVRVASDPTYDPKTEVYEVGQTGDITGEVEPGYNVEYESENAQNWLGNILDAAGIDPTNPNYQNIADELFDIVFGQGGNLLEVTTGTEFNDIFRQLVSNQYDVDTVYEAVEFPTDVVDETTVDAVDAVDAVDTVDTVDTTTVGTGEGTGVSDIGTGEGGDAGAGAGDAGDTTTVGTGAGTEGTGDEGDGVEGIGTDGTGEGAGGDGTGDGTGGAAPISTGGMFSPKPFQGYMGGLSYQIPEFRGVYYQPRDYDVELNRIIQQSLFQGMY